ncbi:hypothetical protein LEP1GSC192_3210 [Leptospira sp. B5-022]|nr:hypothetical protein LEP1GSC192_3210 [Leptospira sp. B5-022]
MKNTFRFVFHTFLLGQLPIEGRMKYFLIFIMLVSIPT